MAKKLYIKTYGCQMRNLFLFPVVLLFTANPLSNALAQAIDPSEPVITLTKPVYFTADSKEPSNLSQNENGMVVKQPDTIFMTDLAPGKLFAAASYEVAVDGKAIYELLTVAVNGTVSLYLADDGSRNYRLTDRRTPDYQAQTLHVNFTRMPELVYVLLEDVKQKEHLSESLKQESPDRYQRIALSDRADRYEAISYQSQASAGYLDSLYWHNGISVTLELDSHSVRLILPEELDFPYCFGPCNGHEQTIFIVPDQGILAKTKGHWVLYDTNGKSIAIFDKAKNLLPSIVTQAGIAYLLEATGPNGELYRLDTQRGKLTKSRK